MSGLERSGVTKSLTEAPTCVGLVFVHSLARWLYFTLPSEMSRADTFWCGRFEIFISQLRAHNSL